MGPIDYSIDVQTPFQAALQGYAGGASIRDDQFKQQQQQVALAQQQQQQKLLQRLSSPNSTADDYSSAMTQIPALAEHLQKAWAVKNTAQQQSQASDLLQWGAAIKSGKPEIAANQMLQRADSMEQGGAPTPESQALRAQAQIVKAHPEFGLGQIQAILAVNPNGKEAATALSSFGTEQRANEQAPAELATKQAEARIKGVQAGAAPETTALANANVASQIEDRKAGQRIAELNVQIGQANSETQRGQLVLERDKLIAEQKKLGVAAGQEQQTQMDSVNQAIDTAGKLLKDPLLDSWAGVGSVVGKLLSYIPGTENKDYRANIATLKSQLFVPAVAQLKAAGGAGALSDAEGKKLDSMVASIDPDMSVKSFKNNVGVIISTMEKHRQKILANPNTPTSGGAFVQNVPGIGTVKEGDINRLMIKFPGTTRQQVLDYLKSQTPQAGGAQGSY